MIELTNELRTILDFVRGCPYSLLVEALAGSGKTTALIECIKILPQPSAIVLAFNKRIADEMVRRLPKLPRNRLVHVRTLHAAGLWITSQHFPKIVVDKDATEKLINQACETGTSLRIRGAAQKLLRLVKDFQHDHELDADYAFYLGSDFGVFDKLEGGLEVQRAVEVTQRAYKASIDIRSRDGIDFCDMGWLPLVLDLMPPSRYRAVLLDEAQDVNPNQLAMVERLLAPGGRIIACGDRWQAIYGWRGATPDETWAQLQERHKATSLPLTVTWRCDRAIVGEANTLVPDLKSRPDAGEGAVSTIEERAFYDEVIVDGSTFVLSRTNAELLRVALEMYRRRISFNITQSKEVIEPLKGVVRKLLKGDVREPVTRTLLDDSAVEDALALFHDRRQRGEAAADKARAITSNGQNQARFVEFRQQIGAWYMTEMMKAQAAGSSTWADRIDEQHRMLLYCLNYVERPSDIERLLDGIFSEDDTCWLTLSTVHKAKGLEADHVFLLRETFVRYQERRDRDGNLLEVPQEELNIEYVGITRAKHNLTWVHLE